jgi:hypothetical protein
MCDNQPDRYETEGQSADTSGNGRRDCCSASFKARDPSILCVNDPLLFPARPPGTGVTLWRDTGTCSVSLKGDARAAAPLCTRLNQHSQQVARLARCVLMRRAPSHETHALLQAPREPTMVRHSALNGMRWERKRLRDVPLTPCPPGWHWTGYTPRIALRRARTGCTSHRTAGGRTKHFVSTYWVDDDLAAE